MVRREDVSGVSGVGTVAEGVQWSNGKVHLHWLGPISTFEEADGIADIERLHGHGGKTVVEWVS